MNKTIVLVVASKGYQPIEYRVPKEVLEKAGIKVITASNESGPAIASKDNERAQVDMLIKNVNPAAYDGVFIIGGPGALEHLDNQDTYNFMQKTAQLHKPFGAICISPRILAHAGLLKHKKATGWDGDNQLADFFAKHNVVYEKKDVVVDGSIVTATGPSAAEQFGQAIVRLLMA